MKLTKLTLHLLAIALLLVAGSAARAAETAPAPDLETTQQAPLLASPDASCSADGQLLASVAAPVPTLVNPPTCGRCSTDGCAGAYQGSLCYTGAGGWGYCDIYQGSNLCPRGGLACSCGTGPIP